jgi:23S rRNA (guanosine2251-2'-O)-methyltransferase
MKHKDNSPDLIFGTKPLIEAITAGKSIDKVMIKRGAQNDSVTQIMRLCKEHEIPFQHVPEIKLNKLVAANHQGVVAFASAVDFVPFEEMIAQILESGNVPLILLLDEISDVRNLGAIARSAECMGVQGIVVLEKGSARIGADALKTSAGALAKMRISRVRKISDAIYYLQGSGIRVFGATERGQAAPDEVDFTVPMALIMGSESHGLSKESLRLCDEFIQIPMSGEINSLNVSVAAGMLLYEVQRQRRSTSS